MKFVHYRTIAGIQIGLHYTWLIAFFIIAWSLARGLFPQLFPGWASSTYWIVGVIAAILLFISVLIHEMCHSLVAKSRGMKVSSIVLFIFGGVSNLEGEPEKAGAEFQMAIVGPLSSLALGGIFYGIAFGLASSGTIVRRCLPSCITWHL
jgi:Zn-dependent protease